MAHRRGCLLGKRNMPIRLAEGAFHMATSPDDSDHLVYRRLFVGAPIAKQVSDRVSIGGIERVEHRQRKCALEEI